MNSIQTIAIVIAQYSMRYHATITLDANELIMPAYMVLNGFVNFGIADNLSVGLNANNLLDAIGITESEEGAITDGQVNYVRARSITGRSISAAIRFTF